MNWRRSTHWKGTGPEAAFGAPATKPSGIWRRSPATAPLTLTAESLTSCTMRPFSSYFRVMGMRTPSTACQSDSTASYVTSPQMLS